MTDETGIMDIRIDGMDDITGAELQEIIDAITEDWDYDAWNFDTLDRIEFPSCTIGDVEDMVEALKRGLPEELRLRARLSMRWWTYDGRYGGLEARMRWEAGE